MPFSPRRVVMIVGVMLVGLVLIWYWIGNAYDPVNVPPAATGPWVAFGDSLTAGQGAEPGQDYPSILGARWGEPIVNLGVNGETTKDALVRLEEIVAMEPRVVLLCLGGNDALQGVPQEETFANLSHMIDRFLARGSFVVLLGVRSASLRDRYAPSFQDLARQKRVLLVPNLLDGILGQPSLMSDYVHPNADGYAEIAAKVAAALEPYRERLRGPSP